MLAMVSFFLFFTISSVGVARIFKSQAVTIKVQTSVPQVVNSLDSIQPGTWARIANTAMLSVVYNGPLSGEIYGTEGPYCIINCWNGATLDTDRSQLLVWGGGHKGYYGNEVYAFNLNTLKWSRLTNPSSVAGWSRFTPLLPDGNPAPPHSYNSMTYIPGVGMAQIGLPAYDDHGSSSKYSFIFNPAIQNPANTGIWQRIADYPANVAPGIVARYDSVTKNVFGIVQMISGGDPFGLFEYDPVSNTWTRKGNTGLPTYVMTGAIDPINRKFVIVGGGFFRAFSLADGTSTSTSSGDQPITDGYYPGFVYYPPAKMFVAWNGGSSVYTLNPTNYQWSLKEAAVGNSVIPTTPNSNGTMGRFQYDATHNVFILVNRLNEDVYVYKPNF